MIDVPVLVKDALRDGRLKKNYRFVIGEEKWHEVGSFETIGWYSPSTNYGDDKKYTIRDTKTYKFVVDDADHDTYTLYIYKGTDPNWRTVEATSRNTWDITLINEAYAYVEIKSSSGNYYSPVSVQSFFAYTLDNNNLVSESVSIDERMCSGDTLKFGLCEGSSLEFQYFDFPNITGQRIQAFVDVESEEMEYSKIHELKRSYYRLPADGRYKITATSANMANIFALFFVHGTTTTRMEFTVAQDGHGEIELPNAKRNNDIYLDYRTGTTPTAEVFQWGHKWHTIPLGFFDVKKCSRQASTGIIKVEAYNKLQSEYLDAKANELIKEMFSNPDNPIHVIDIETLLLNNFGIREEVREHIPQSAIHSDGDILPITTSIKAIVQYGINNPFNYLNMDGQTCYLWINTCSPWYDISPNSPYRISFQKDFEYYERAFYSQLMQVFEEARLNKSAASIMDTFMTGHSAGGYVYHGFQDCIGIELVKDDNTVEYYSTIGYENHCNGVVGTWKDLSRKIIIGYKKIIVHLPYILRASTSVSDPRQELVTVNMDFFGTTGVGYPYYVDSAHNTAFGYYPDPIRYSDGSVINYQDVGSASKFDVDKILNLSAAELIELIPTDLPDVTLRELQTATYETVCQFGQLSRITDLFSGVELNRSRLYPADDLYPSEGLYPDGAQESGFRSQYSQLWADEGNIHKWRYLIITYKGLDGDGNEIDRTLQRTINNDGTDNYNMSDNWLFRNLVWTAEQVGAYADAMVLKMRDITWFPFEMWCAGLPYLETGDEIEITLGEETYTSYILQRQLKGIQNLQDTYINGTLDIF